MRTTWAGLWAGAALGTFASAAGAQDLVIFWAEWDPANYLQELVGEYEAETGVEVLVETTPWADFQTKAFTEFNARGSAYDMVVGDSQWLGAASEAGHYVELTDFFAANGLADLFVPATVTAYAEYPPASRRYWAVPAQADAAGWSYRCDWFEDPAEMAAFEERYGYPLAVPADWSQMRDVAEHFHRPDEGRYGVAIYTDNSYDALVMGVQNAIFSFGGSLGDYSTFAVDGLLNGPEAVAGLEAYRALFEFTPPGWSQAFFVENNQAITENLAAMSMNFFAFFPALVNPATNPNAAGTCFFANPPGPTGAQAASLGGQGISIVSYSDNQEEALAFLEWFIRDDVQARWAELGGYTASAAVLSSEAFRSATPYNEAFYQTMQIVRDFWAVPEFAELLTAANRRLYPYVVGGEGTAQEALDALAADWTATFREYGRIE